MRTPRRRCDEIAHSDADARTTTDGMRAAKQQKLAPLVLRTSPSAAGLGRWAIPESMSRLEQYGARIAYSEDESEIYTHKFEQEQIRASDFHRAELAPRL